MTGESEAVLIDKFCIVLRLDEMDSRGPPRRAQQRDQQTDVAFGTNRAVVGFFARDIVWREDHHTKLSGFSNRNVHWASELFHSIKQRAVMVRAQGDEYVPF